MSKQSSDSSLNDEFPDTPARRAVVGIVRSYGAVQRAMSPYFAQFDLTPPQFQLLTVLNRLNSENVSQRQLGRELYVSFPNITVMLSRLENSGLIRRRSNPDDGREKFVGLTRDGRALLHRIWKVHQEQLEQAMLGLNNRERLQLAGLLNKMIAAHQ